MTSSRLLLWVLVAASTAVAQDGKVFIDSLGKVVDCLYTLNNPPASPDPNDHCSDVQLNIQGNVEKEVSVLRIHKTEFLRYARGLSPDYRFLEDARTDKQIGATNASSGSTSLVSKGTVPKFFGFAVENGALTNSTSGTSTTFRGNLVGWLDLVRNQGFIESYNDNAKVVNALRRISYSFTLDSSRTPAAVQTGSGIPTLASLQSEIKRTGQQLANYSVRLAILDKRDPRTKQNRQGIFDFLDKNAKAFLDSRSFLTDCFLDAVFYGDNPNLCGTTPQGGQALPEYYKQWLGDTTRRLSQGGLSRGQIILIFHEQVELLRRTMVERIPNFQSMVEAALDAATLFDSKRLDLFKKMQKQPLVSVEYVNTRLPTLPDLSTVRFIAEGSFFNAKLDLTGNIAFTIQNSGTVLTPSPQKLGGLRDFQVAAQGEVPLGSLAKSIAPGTGIGTMSLAFAYLSERLSDQSAVSFAGYNFMAEPGWIHVGQVKLTIPVKGSGVKIPLSFSVANRTELIREKDVRAHIGVTFDMDALIAGFKK